MVATHNDSYQIAQDPVFQNRVQAALAKICVDIANEGWAVAFHRERQGFAAQILANTNVNIDYTKMFANAVSTDTTVLSDATQAGTVAVTAGNRATQSALVTDAHMDTAISAEFNAFFRVPS